MNSIDHLMKYKAAIVGLSHTNQERRFLQDSFTRWYFNSSPDINFIPQNNIVNPDDLYYANNHKKCNFNIRNIIEQSVIFFNKMKKELANSKEEIYKNQDDLISGAQLTRLKKIYIDADENFEADKNKLIAIYNFIGMNSIHMSIPPIFEGIELFGSPLNTHNPFCSPFKFEKIFSSLGSFFDFNIAESMETIFTANPPFDEAIMEQMAKRLDAELLKSKNNKTIIITIPVWDSASQKLLNIPDYEMDFKAFDLLKKSKFFIANEILDKKEYPYWDYYKQALIPVSYTHLIILTNGKPKYTLAEIKQKWKKFQPQIGGRLKKKSNKSDCKKIQSINIKSTKRYKSKN